MVNIVSRIATSVALTTLLARTTHAGLATTTHYSDGLQGACGCGTDVGTYNWQYGLDSAVYTAAANQALFDTTGGMDHWCGSGCGKCYRLTSTGVSACPTCGAGGDPGKSITVMVTNLCPFQGNEQWCPNPGQLNPYGYAYHFDIMGGEGVFGDNVVVEFQEVPCPGVAALRWGTCECHPSLRGLDLSSGAHTGGVALVSPAEALPLDGPATGPNPAPVPFAPAGNAAAPVPPPPPAPAPPAKRADTQDSLVETLATAAKTVETVAPAPAN
ncbi:RlpA-like double-psi beta-barrel-protein domain-containing protein-containing protein [Aspergillus egyptiacus]|nr:RlpA-like double-psi beta-barrel-protein domain-containing protein-containing protein [Aspergillus egyptiacus]